MKLCLVLFALLALNPTAAQKEDKSTNLNTATVEQEETNTLKSNEEKEKDFTIKLNTTTLEPRDTNTLKSGMPKKRLHWIGCKYGNCGKQSPNGCWCDSLCPHYGDCCANYRKHCGCGPFWTEWHSNCYQYFDEARTWFAAQARCEQEHGNLVSVRSAYEEQFLITLIPSYKHVWIGGRDIYDPARFWAWSDGSSWKYTNWLSGEPNDCCGGEDCVEIMGSRKWNDKDCNNQQPFICKKK